MMVIYDGDLLQQWKQEEIFGCRSPSFSRSPGFFRPRCGTYLLSASGDWSAPHTVFQGTQRLVRDKSVRCVASPRACRDSSGCSHRAVRTQAAVESAGVQHTIDFERDYGPRGSKAEEAPPGSLVGPAWAPPRGSGGGDAKVDMDLL